MLYQETEIHCDNPTIRCWVDNNGYEWVTDTDCNYLGETIEEALQNLEKVSP